MDFSNWLFEPTETFTSALLAIGIPSADIYENALLWNDYAWDASQNAVPIPASDCSSNSPGSSRSNSYATQSDHSTTEQENSSNSKAVSRRTFPINCERNATLNRIQRRRTQNRNSQRVYRQRRIDERRVFETRAIAAEESSRQMGVHLRELQSIISSLRYKVQQLEAENLALRISTCSMPWRKASLQP